MPMDTSWSRPITSMPHVEPTSHGISPTAIARGTMSALPTSANMTVSEDTGGGDLAPIMPPLLLLVLANATTRL